MADEIGELDVDKLTEGDFIPATAGYEHGYWGYTPDKKAADYHTVANQVGDTANVSDKPDDAKAARVRKNFEPLSNKPQPEAKS